MTNACSTPLSTQVTPKTPSLATATAPVKNSAIAQKRVTGTVAPTSQIKKLTTPFLKGVIASRGYIGCLEEAKALGTQALEENKWNDYFWKQDLYELLRHLETVAPEEFKSQTARLFVDMRKGLEFMDHRPIREALNSIDQIQSQMQ
jgi:hypothetical protein